MKTERLAYYRGLARQGNKNAQRVCDAFDPDQPRDPDGKWGGGGGGSAKTAAEHLAQAEAHKSEMMNHKSLMQAAQSQHFPAGNYYHGEAYNAHADAAAAHLIAARSIEQGKAGSAEGKEAEAASATAYAATAKAVSVRPVSQAGASKPSGMTGGIQRSAEKIERERNLAMRAGTFKMGQPARGAR